MSHPDPPCRQKHNEGSVRDPSSFRSKTARLNISGQSHLLRTRRPEDPVRAPIGSVSEADDLASFVDSETSAVGFVWEVGQLLHACGLAPDVRVSIVWVR